MNAQTNNSESAPPALKLAGVCGWPIHHSLSPVLHSFWLKKLRLSGAYVHFAVRPDNALHAFQSLKRTSITGVNVTSPLKKFAYDAADEQTPDARKLGVANCLYKRGDKLVAHNTDLEGFAAPLLTHYGAHSVMNVSALVIGTGGAAHGGAQRLGEEGRGDERRDRQDRKRPVADQQAVLGRNAKHVTDDFDGQLEGKILDHFHVSAVFKGVHEIIDKRGNARLKRGERFAGKCELKQLTDSRVIRGVDKHDAAGVMFV